MNRTSPPEVPDLDELADCTQTVANAKLDRLNAIRQSVDNLHQSLIESLTEPLTESLTRSLTESLNQVINNALTLNSAIITREINTIKDDHTKEIKALETNTAAREMNGMIQQSASFSKRLAIRSMIRTTALRKWHMTGYGCLQEYMSLFPI
ncbi:hypothetical protein E0Z10_g6402 [Xylaria hypoxylon]|uniref:Uncharacterized protein n=1 Tax=Xylaria hypoxylon TaxID=37992 RepID=A0A4Z0YG63_9PEZI|nr:hypothetical protein E0Z10_g6402 [Xylaria hypoxylon]